VSEPSGNGSLEPCSLCGHAELVREARSLLVERAVDALQAGMEPYDLIGLLAGEQELPPAARAALGLLLKRMDGDSLAQALTRAG
jgi:hypothetical protein